MQDNNSRYVAGTHGTVLPTAVSPFLLQAKSRIGTQPEGTVIIDPQAPKPIMLDLSTLHASTIQNATAEVMQETQPADIRQFGAAVLQKVASQNPQNVVQSVGSGVPQSYSQQQGQNYARPILPQPVNAGNQVMTPVRAFEQQSMFNQPAQAPAAATPVVFETEGFGQLQVAYADVIVRDNIIVLVHDNRSQSPVRFFPQPSASPQRMLMQVADAPTVYEVQPTIVRFEHGTCEYCVLSVVGRFGTEGQQGQG